MNDNDALKRLRLSHPMYYIHTKFNRYLILINIYVDNDF